MTVHQLLLQPKGRIAPCWFALACIVMASPVLAQPQPEVQVTTREISDFEFDWGNDGVFCPTCNAGAGNARFAFVDRQGQLWVGNVDVATGDFIPSDGRGVLVDVDAAIASDFGNGPEWMFSTDGSQITYTKYLSGQPPTPENAGIALATLIPGGWGWSAGFLPGGDQRKSPLASLDLNDPQPRLVYTDLDSIVLWRYASDPESEAPVPQIVGSAGASRRWVPGLQQLVFTTKAPPVSGGPGIPQVFIYDLPSQVVEQLTSDYNSKWGVFMWQAPEFGNEYIMFVLVNRNELIAYRKFADRHGELRWQETTSIKGTIELPFIWSPEPFVHNGHSYIIMQLSSSPDPTNVGVPSHIAIVGIEPEHLPLRVLTDESGPPRVRMDPEYYITEQGPFIYYPRYHMLTDTTLFYSEGVWRVDTGLGPPVITGVGSSDRAPDLSAFRRVYPNPATHQQTFEILVAPDRPLQELRVYDVLGRHVMERSLRELGPGTYEIEWDGRDDNGRQLSSGVYYVTVESPSGRQSRKIVRVR